MNSDYDIVDYLTDEQAYQAIQFLDKQGLKTIDMSDFKERCLAKSNGEYVSSISKDEQMILKCLKENYLLFADPEETSTNHIFVFPKDYKHSAARGLRDKAYLDVLCFEEFDIL